MATKTINVTKAFILTTRGETGEIVRIPFLPGIQNVDEAIANNWYVKAHSADIPTIEPTPVAVPVKPSTDGGKKT